nr:ORF1 [Torque teno felis virus]
MWKRRRTFRRRHRGLRRRGRYHPRHRFWRRRWRRRANFNRVMRQHMPGRTRTIIVRGWEPLGNLCKNDGPKSEATPWVSVEPQANAYPTGVWHGTWGKHYHTPNNLLLRAQYGWNSWSDNWTTFDYCRFVGATITIPQPEHNMILMNFDPYLQTKVNPYGESNKEDLYVHPGVLLQMPKTHIIMPFSKKHRQRFYKIRIGPPPGWAGYHRFPDAMGYIFYHWCWTWCSFKTAFYNSWTNAGQLDTCPQAPWWATNSDFNKWKNRTKYDDNTSQAQLKMWGPFLPPKPSEGSEESFFFFYKIKLKLAGDSIWRPVPTNFQRDGLVPTPEGPNGDRADTETNSKKKKRPTSVFDIMPDDLDSDGILQDRAYTRITGDHPPNKRSRVENTRRLGSLYDRVYHILSEFNLLK